MACAAGPLMLEPMFAVGFAVEAVEVAASFPGLPSSLSSSSSSSASSSAAAGGGGDGAALQSGQLISDTLEALRLGFLSCPVRVVEPVYSCNLQCDQGQLGNLYAVLSRRRGVVVKEDVIDGTSLFVLTATVPLADSFGFAQELLKKTSGAATAPQMCFSHWQVQDTDPFWRATTEEELEEHGDTSALAAHSNPARALIDKVRKRKGQVVEEKVVASAEKQRTLNKKK
jgi:ribosome assembly protein 1